MTPFNLMTCLLVGISLLTGCSNDDSTPFEEKTYTADVSQIHSIVIDVKDRKIDLSLSKDDQIYLEYYENEEEYYDLTVTDDQTLKMTTKTNKEWSDYMGSKTASDYRTISLQVPSGMLKSLTLSTTNEDLFIPALQLTENISISLNNGDLELEQLDVLQDIELKAKNGNISGSILGSYDDFSITSKAKKGKNNLPEQKVGGDQRLMISTNNGDINLELVNP